jgi:hypothetical protein
MSLPPRRSRSGVSIWLLVAFAAALIGITAWSWWTIRVAVAPLTAIRASRSAADVRQQELLDENIERPGDPGLARAYQLINAKHFGGALPALTIRWEPKLDEVGALAQGRFTLEGMVGRVGKRLVMLLNPSLQSDAKAFDRALCHEMAHVYLLAHGDENTHHGPAFKNVLRRLSEEGAFEGIDGTDSEKRQLRAWLDRESARLDRDERELAEIGGQIDRERAELDATIADFNRRAQITDGSVERPSADDVQAVEARRQRFNDLVTGTNARLERGRAALAHFNDEVDRYNLMLVYPDGMDEEARVPAKPAAGR